MKSLTATGSFPLICAEVSTAFAAFRQTSFVKQPSQGYKYQWTRKHS